MRCLAVPYLGHRYYRDGIHMREKDIDAVEHALSHRNMGELQWMFGNAEILCYILATTFLPTHVGDSSGEAPLHQ